MINQSFFISRLPQIHFGPGSLGKLPEIINTRKDKRVLLITGKKSFHDSPAWRKLTHQLTTQSIEWWHTTVANEPSPQLIDDIVQQFKDYDIQLVVAIGGGSVMDAGKAIAGLLPFGNSVMDHLEGVGKGIPYHGPATPFIAIPTTAGTGSEATKNAVLTHLGSEGYKKSFRHDTLVPSYAIVDPDLLATCPQELIAANGMDAFTQLLESYVSSGANPFTDALALSGMQAINKGFVDAWENANNPQAREAHAAMAYAALLSGITLAQAGLGAVHGLAAPLGAFFPIGHGVVCGCLLSAATEINLKALNERDTHHPALIKYAEIGRLLSGQQALSIEQAHTALLDQLKDWTLRFQIPTLSKLGVSSNDFDKIVANCRGNSMKTNPVHLSDSEVIEVLKLSA